jgi:hypothetical protein
MRTQTQKRKILLIVLASLAIVFMAGCCGEDCKFPQPPAALIAPTVSATAPACSATGVDLGSKVTATFSKAMDPTSITGTTFTLSAGAAAVPGTVTYAALTNIATFTPTAALLPATVYTITVTTGAKDVAGTPLVANFSCTFTTGPPFLGPPTIVSTSPVAGLAPCVNAGQVTATFSKSMDPATINTTTFTVTGPGLTAVPGTVTYDVANKRATFTPTNAFAVNTTFTATVTNGAKDLAGAALVAGVAPNPWQFQSCASVAPPAVACNLGTANSFVVLAGTTVSNTGPSAVGGDVGVSPGTAIVGFPPGIVSSGSIFAGGSTPATAQADLTTGYNDVASRVLPAPATVAGNIGGQTLTAGIYKSTSSLSISSGNLTLDAQGNSNAVFIFQISSSLTTTVGTQVILAGGAKANNVCWQVGSSATLGTNSIFKGNIMALTSITLTTGAVMDGRALARNGAVTLDSNIITKPAP